MVASKRKLGIKKRKPNSPRLFYEYSLFFRKDSDNVIFQVTSDQLPILNRIGLDDLFMSKGHIREPHWHPNAAEMDYVVSGQVSISVLDPIRHRLLTYHVIPGEVVFIPMNWWHWITALCDEVHVVQVFSSAKRQIIEGSDMLRKTPPKVFQQAYDINAKPFASLLSPITETVVIGPPECVELTSIAESANLNLPRAANVTVSGMSQSFLQFEKKSRCTKRS